MAASSANANHPPLPGCRPPWQESFFPGPLGLNTRSTRKLMRIASHLDIYRLATIALCNIPLREDDLWTRPGFDRTSQDLLTGVLSNLTNKFRTMIMDPKFIVAVIYDISKGLDYEWALAGIHEPGSLDSTSPWLNPRPVPVGEMDVVGFIVIELGWGKYLNPMHPLVPEWHPMLAVNPNPDSHCARQWAKLKGPEMPPMQSVQVPSPKLDMTISPQRFNLWRHYVARTITDLTPPVDPSWCRGKKLISFYVHPAYYSRGFLEDLLIGWAVNLFGTGNLLYAVATNSTKLFFEKAGFGELVKLCAGGTRLSPEHHGLPELHDETNFDAGLMFYNPAAQVVGRQPTEEPEEHPILAGELMVYQCHKTQAVGQDRAAEEPKEDSPFAEQEPEEYALSVSQEPKEESPFIRQEPGEESPPHCLRKTSGRE